MVKHQYSVVVSMPGYKSAGPGSNPGLGSCHAVHPAVHPPYAHWLIKWIAEKTWGR